MNATVDPLDPNASDEALASAAQHGDVRAFGLLAKRYYDKISRYAKRMLYLSNDTEDLVQDVFVKAYEGLQSFNIQRRFSPWIYRIAHNTFVNHLRKSQHAALPFFDPETLFPHPVAADNPHQDFQTAEERAQLEAALQGLDPKYREPLALYYLENMSYEEIADVLHISLSAVGVRIHRAKALVRQHAPHLHP